jgi:hypothetical protein
VRARGPDNKTQQSTLGLTRGGLQQALHRPDASVLLGTWISRAGRGSMMRRPHLRSRWPHAHARAASLLFTAPPHRTRTRPDHTKEEVGERGRRVCALKPIKACGCGCPPPLGLGALNLNHSARSTPAVRVPSGRAWARLRACAGSGCGRGWRAVRCAVFSVHVAVFYSGAGASLACASGFFQGVSFPLASFFSHDFLFSPGLLSAFTWPWPRPRARPALPRR